MSLLMPLLRTITVLAAAAVLMAACSTTEQGVLKENLPPATFNIALPGLDSPERQVLALNFGSRLGDEVYAKSPLAVGNDFTHQLLMNPGAEELVWAIYQLGPFVEGDELVHVFVSPEIDPDPPATYYIALADYATGRWQFEVVSPSDGDDWVTRISQEQPFTSFSPAGFAYIAVLAYDEIPLTINEVGWNYNSADNVTNVDASDGLYMDEVRITWGEVAGATGYDLYYYAEGQSPEERVLLAEVEGASSTEFSHSEINPPGLGSDYGLTYFYELKAVFADESISPQFSIAESGFRMLPAPQNFIATDGYSPTLIELSWDPVPVADGYSIFRDGVFLQAIAEPDETVFIDDAGEVELGYLAHEYYVVSHQGALDSLPSAPSTGRLADWRIFDIDGLIAATAAVEAMTVLDKPVAALYDESEGSELYGASYVQSEAAVPDSANDFQHHYFDPVSDGAGKDMSLAIVSGLPAIAMWNKGDGGLYYARATLTAPGSNADWDIHLALPEISNPGVSLSSRGLFGSPMIVSCNIDETEPEVPNGLQIGISSGVPFPQSAEDWTWHSVDADVLDLDDSILLTEGGTLITYIVRQDSGGQVNDLRAAYPAGSMETWNTMDVDEASEVSGSLSARRVNGTPWVLYADNSIPGASVRLARGRVPDPLEGADWNTVLLTTPLPETNAQILDLNLLELQGKPAFMASLHEVTAAEQSIFIVRSKVDVPEEQADWFGGRLTFDAPFHGDASMTSLSNGQPALFYVDTDDDFNWQLRYFYQAAP